MLSINLGSNDLEQKEHKWHLFYKAAISVITVTIPANVFFSSQVNDIRQLVMTLSNFKKSFLKAKILLTSFLLLLS